MPNPNPPIHICSLLFNPLQLIFIQTFILTYLPPPSLSSASSYLQRLDAASNSAQGAEYIALYTSGLYSITDLDNEEYEELNVTFEAPTPETRKVTLQAHFTVKAEMEKEMGRKWSIEDKEVRGDFGRVFVSNLQKLKLIVPYY